MLMKSHARLATGLFGLLCLAIGNMADGKSMKIPFNPYEIVVANRKIWRPWFAWRPIWIGDNLVWLETVWRRHHVGYEGSGWDVEYSLERPEK